MTSALPAPHSLLLERVRDAVASDNRLSALLIGGSYVHGGLDEHSDLDFVVVVEQDDYDDVMETRVEFAETIGDMVSCFTGEHVGEPRLLICLYGPPLVHVDFKFVLLSDFEQQIERRALLYAKDAGEIERAIGAGSVSWPNHSPEWFEARIWIWLHYAITKLHRGELYEAIGMLGFIREQVIGPMLYRRAGLNQRGVRRLEASKLDKDVDLAGTVAKHDRDSVRRALITMTGIYLDLRRDGMPVMPRQNTPDLILEFIDETNRTGNG